MNCEKCGNENLSNSKFCQDCGTLLKFIKKEELSREEENIHIGQNNSEMTKIGFYILIITVIFSLLVTELPIAKATNNEENYSAYYDIYLEKLERSDPEAPRKLISDNELESFYLDRIAETQLNLALIILVSIFSIFYSNFYDPNNETQNLVNALFKKIYIVTICLLLYSPLSLIGISFEKFVEEGIILLPLMSITYIVYSIIILKYCSKIKVEEKTSIAKKKINLIFETAMCSILVIPIMPWFCATFIPLDGGDGLVYSEITILSEGKSQYAIYEMGKLAKNLESMIFILWSIVLVSILGELGLNIKNNESSKTMTSHFLIIFSNINTFLAIIIVYINFIFFFNVEEFETYINEIGTNGNTSRNYLFFPNYIPLIFSMYIVYQALRFNISTLSESYKKLLKEM